MSERIHEATGVAADAAGRTVIGFLAEAFPNRTVEVKRVIAEQTGAADADFNVEAGGQDVFSGEQSVANADTPEGFSPDQNRYEASETSDIAVDVSNASGTGGSTLNVTVVVDVHGED